jgi:hypothetical protein
LALAWGRINPTVNRGRQAINATGSEARDA